MLLDDLEIAKRHASCNMELVERVLQQDPIDVENLITHEARKIYNFIRQVKMEAHKIESFVRLKVSKHGILYGKMDSKHDIEDMVIRFFTRRFPTFVILIHSKKKSYIGKNGSKTVIMNESMKRTLHELESNMPITDFNEDFDMDIWDKYYQSQVIQERKNKKLFLHNIPKKYHTLLPYERFIYTENKKLDQFM